MAPVPYSISTKLAIQTGKLASGRNGWRDPQPGVEAALLRRLDRRLAGAQAAAFGDEGGRLRRSRAATAAASGCSGASRQERHAEQRVRPRGVDLDPVDRRLRLRRAESASARPRCGRSSWPASCRTRSGQRSQPVQRRQQLGRVVGDAQEPLRKLLLLDRRAGAPAAAVDHLLVGEHGAVHRVPVDPALAPLGEAGAQEVQEQPLLLAVIGRIAGGELARPVERQAHALQLGAHGGDVGAGPGGGMDAALARRVLGRQAERVPAHRVQHRVAPRPLVARHHVAERVVAHMPHVDLAAGVGKHLQHVVFRLAVASARRRTREAAALVPHALPVRLGGGEIVARQRRLRKGCGEALG